LDDLFIVGWVAGAAQCTWAFCIVALSIGRDGQGVCALANTNRNPQACQMGNSMTHLKKMIPKKVTPMLQDLGLSSNRHQDFME